MPRVFTVRRLATLSLVVAGAFLLAASESADARPQYLKSFIGKYPALASQAKQNKCNVCHFGKSKKNRNDYAKVLMKNVGKKNQKDQEKIVAALEKTGKAKKPGTKTTFGALIKAGKLPGTTPAS